MTVGYGVILPTVYFPGEVALKVAMSVHCHKLLAISPGMTLDVARI